MYSRGGGSSPEYTLVVSCDSGTERDGLLLVTGQFVPDLETVENQSEKTGHEEDVRFITSRAWWRER